MHRPGEHNPPHVHAYYQKFKAIIDIKTCELSEESLPSKQRKFVLAWAGIHQEELLADWELASNGEHPFVIVPLKQEIVMYLSVIGVTPLGDHTLMLEFENREKRVFDMSPYFDTGRFSELRDPLLFRSVAVKYDSIEWPNRLDLDPEFFVRKKCRRFGVVNCHGSDDIAENLLLHELLVSFGKSCCYTCERSRSALISL